MTAKRIYAVSVSIDFDMYVVAEDEDAAEQVARDNIDREIDNIWLSNEAQCSVREPGEFDKKEESIPWGLDDDDSDRDKTVAELLAEQAERDREAEEARRIEANQLKLPLGGE